MALNFAHETLGQRLLFGSGMAASNVAAEVARLGASRVMLIAAPFEQAIADTVMADVNIHVTYNDVVQHVPIEKAEDARRVAAENDVDLLVSVGGGSTTGLAKAIALTTGIPIIAVATTYAGSEATNVWGLTEAARKTTGVDARVLPVTVVYDAELTYSLPVELSVASGMNAADHTRCLLVTGAGLRITIQSHSLCAHRLHVVELDPIARAKPVFCPPFRLGNKVERISEILLTEDFGTAGSKGERRKAEFGFIEEISLVVSRYSFQVRIAFHADLGRIFIGRVIVSEVGIVENSNAQRIGQGDFQEPVVVVDELRIEARGIWM